MGNTANNHDHEDLEKKLELLEFSEGQTQNSMSHESIREIAIDFLT